MSDDKPSGDDITKLRHAFDLFKKYGAYVAAAVAIANGIIDKVDSNQRTAAVEQKVENKGAQVLEAVKETVVPTVKRSLSTDERLTALEATTLAQAELLKDLTKRSSPEHRKKLVAKVDEKVAKNLAALNARAAADVPAIKPLPATLPPVTAAPPKPDAGQ
jgi:DNA relaxase NicK